MCWFAYVCANAISSCSCSFFLQGAERVWGFGVGGQRSAPVPVSALDPTHFLIVSFALPFLCDWHTGTEADPGIFHGKEIHSRGLAYLGATIISCRCRFLNVSARGRGRSHKLESTIMGFLGGLCRVAPESKSRHDCLSLQIPFPYIPNSRLSELCRYLCREVSSLESPRGPQCSIIELLNSAHQATLREVVEGFSALSKLGFYEEGCCCGWPREPQKSRCRHLVRRRLWHRCLELTISDEWRFHLLWLTLQHSSAVPPT